MDQVPGDVLALFIEEVQRLAQGAVGSFCFHPLPPPRLGFARQRKLLTQLPNLACRAGCTPIHRRVEDGRGGLGHAASPRFPSPLIKPDVRISRIRLSDWFHLAAHGGGRVRCVLPKQWAMADAPSNTDRRPSSPRGKASSEASGYAGVFQAHRPSPIRGSLQSAPEARALSSASMARPPRSYGPLRLPSDPPPVRRWGCQPPVETGLPRLPASPFQRAVPRTPGGSRRVPVSIASPLTRPSPFPRRVGIRIFTFEMLWGGRWRDVTIVAGSNAMERPMAQQLDDLSRSLTPLEQDSTIIAVIEMSQASWLVAGVVPGIERHPLKKLEPSEVELLRLFMRWRAEATQKGRTITRIAVAYEAGRDGFWLARWLRARGIEAYVIHPTSVAVSREHRRAKTDRLDTGLLKRVFLGWLRGEPDHCHMAAIPTVGEEDARPPSREREGLVRERTRLVNRMKSCLVRFGVRTFKPTLRKAPDRLATLRTPEGVPLPPNTLLELRRDMARLRFVMDQIKEIEAARAQGLEQAPEEKPHVMVHLLARVIGIGVETADMLVHEVLARTLRDRRAVARYAGLTGSPDESGSRRREKGLAKAGNARVRRGMVQLAWRFLLFQKDSALAQWYRARTADARGGTRKTMIVALARKLLIALWRFVATGEAPAGVVLRPAS